MKPQYEPKTMQQKLGYLVEECGEVHVAAGAVQAAVGKTIRWGLDSSNPELPVDKRETNARWLLRELEQLDRELEDLRRATGYARAALLDHIDETDQRKLGDT